MLNVGEELVGAYLQYIKDCEFIQKNLYTEDSQGEIDVVGIDLEGKKVYVCEVAIHLQGLQYTKNNRPDNYNRLVAKFSKDIIYAQKYFSDYELHFMFWSPVVRIPKSSEVAHNPMEDVVRVKSTLKENFGVELEIIVNKDFLERIEALRNFSRIQSKELQSPIVRMLQIEEHLRKHVSKLE